MDGQKFLDRILMCRIEVCKLGAEFSIHACCIIYGWVNKTYQSLEKKNLGLQFNFEIPYFYVLPNEWMSWSMSTKIMAIIKEKIKWNKKPKEILYKLFIPILEHFIKHETHFFLKSIIRSFSANKINNTLPWVTTSEKNLVVPKIE